MKVLSALLVVILLNPVLAQPPDVKQSVQEALQKIAPMIGAWEGRGWRIGPDREKRFSNVREIIQWKLDETLILIEGVGRNDDGDIVHDALGVLSFDPFRKSYEISSYISKGLSSSSEFTVLEEDRFRWEIQDRRGGTTRYTIAIRDGNEWHEVGEYSQDGQEWRQFFEMNLRKVD